jgi:hypothetical protein
MEIIDLIAHQGRLLAIARVGLFGLKRIAADLFLLKFNEA